MSNDYEAIYQYHLMIRRGVNSLISFFSLTMERLDPEEQGLGHLLVKRNKAKDREHWTKSFDPFYERWAGEFAEACAGDLPERSAVRDAGLQCLGEIRNDLRNDLWTDKAMQRKPSPELFVRFFWAQVRQKMIYAPIMVGCGVSRERAIRMTKFAQARREILLGSLQPPDTDQAMFVAIADHIGERWSTVEKIGRDLPIFLKARGGYQPSLRALDEIDFLDAETELARSFAGRNRAVSRPLDFETTSASLFDLLPIGSAVAHDEIIFDVLDVLTEHCIPELKKRDSILFAELKNWRKKIDKNNEEPAPEESSGTQGAFRLLRACIEREFRRRLK